MNCIIFLGGETSLILVIRPSDLGKMQQPANNACYPVHEASAALSAAFHLVPSPCTLLPTA